jgi:hypothetical protein
VTEHLREQEGKRLGLELRARRDHVALALARRIPDDHAAAGRDLRHDLLDAEPPGDTALPGHRRDHALKRAARATLVALREPVEQIALEVHAVADLEPAERRGCERYRHERDREAIAVHLRDGQADAVDGHRSLRHQ